MNLLVKICGLTTEQDVAAALASGADALGFVFAESPRRVTPAHAAAISEQIPTSILRVAVMLHPSPGEWTDVARVFRPDVLQTDAPDLDALVIGEEVRRWPVYREGGLHLLSPSVTEYVYEGPKSGQGETVNWDNAAWLAKRNGMILAGGLGPDNVADAVRAVKPFGVDASSSLESSPGRKSTSKMRAYVAAAKTAARALAGNESV